MSDNIILDTHILIWSLLKPEELSEETKKIICDAQNSGSLIISSISLWEVAMLNFKKRIHIYEPVQSFLKSISEISGMTVCDISPEIAAESVALLDNFHGDPADRIIVATTKAYAGTLLTRDSKILDWAQLGNVKFLKS